MRGDTSFDQGGENNRGRGENIGGEEGRKEADGVRGRQKTPLGY